jgi:hypothetical protein
MNLRSTRPWLQDNGVIYRYELLYIRDIPFTMAELNSLGDQFLEIRSSSDFTHPSELNCCFPSSNIIQDVRAPPWHIRACSLCNCHSAFNPSQKRREQSSSLFSGQRSRWQLDNHPQDIRGRFLVLSDSHLDRRKGVVWSQFWR